MMKKIVFFRHNVYNDDKEQVYKIKYTECKLQRYKQI